MKVYEYTEPASYFFTGTGATPAKAKAAYIERCKEAVRGTYNPLIIEQHGVGVLVYRMPESWCTSLIAMPGKPLREQPLYGSALGYTTRDEAESAARSHVAEILRDLGYDGTVVLKTDAQRRQYERNAAWQVRYAAARARGLDDVCAHRAAGEADDHL